MSVGSEQDRDKRVERVAFETDRQRIVGDMTLPAAGYQSRFSDSLNRGEFRFVALTEVEITPLDGGATVQLPFVVVAKDHVRYAYPLGDG